MPPGDGLRDWWETAEERWDVLRLPLQRQFPEQPWLLTL